MHSVMLNRDTYVATKLSEQDVANMPFSGVASIQLVDHGENVVNVVH